MPATITILLAAYRSGAFIARTLNSIQNQTFRDFTCLIADDDSGDDTVDLIRARIEGDPRFVVRENPVNLGWTANINQLLDQVATPFFMIMPHDDELEPTYLMKTIEALDRRPEAIAAYSDVLLRRPDGAETLRNLEWADEPDAVQRGLYQLARKECWWIPYRALVRTEFGGDVRLRKHPLGEFEADLPWLLDLGLRGPMVRVPEVLYEKHALPNSLSRIWRTGPLEFCSVSWACFHSIRESPLQLPGKLKLSAFLVRKALGRFIHRPPSPTPSAGTQH